ncbi:MAG: glycosyltransferase family 2 protein [Anaerolineae bacterium]
MADLPIVSVCIPAFNSEATLGRTLDSVLAQDYRGLDIVVSDNQSTDRTKAVVQGYTARGVRYCWHAEGRPSWAAALPSYIGGFANWDFVLSQGRGQFLCLFHSDDLYSSSIVSKQAALMAGDPAVGAVFTMLRTIGEDDRPIGLGCSHLPPEMRGRHVFGFAELLNATLRHGNILPTPSVMLRQPVVAALGGFDERNCRTAADLDMWLRIARRYQIGVIDEPLLNYRISARQFGSQYNRMRTNPADYFTVMDRHLSDPDVLVCVAPDALESYERRRIADDVFRAKNLALQGFRRAARDVLVGALSRTGLRAVVGSRSLRRTYVLGWLLLIAGRLGIDRSVAMAYERTLKRSRQLGGLRPVSERAPESGVYSG